MKIEVSYLPPDKGGAIIKGGRTKLVPETRVEPSQDLAGLMPHSNITRTRSKVKVAVWISTVSLIVAVGFLIMGAFWLWHIDDREKAQAEWLGELKQTLDEQQEEINRMRNAGGRIDVPKTSDACKLPKRVGTCRAAVPRWYYDQSSDSCKSFNYGGCDGNENNFETEAQCNKQCKNDEGDVCQLPAEVGPCRSLQPKFFYNPKSGECEQFGYGGCNGNGNRFESRFDCEKRCRPDPEVICRLPSETGSCRAAMVRYFFNPDSGKCEMFTWGGCGGNENRFETEDECNKACGDIAKQK